MVEMGERELLLTSLKGYLEDLLESGLDELAFGEEATAAAPVLPKAAPAAIPTAAPTAAPAAMPPALSAAMPAVAPAAMPAAAQDIAGVGNPRARLLFVLAGAGFAGPGGELLAKIIVAMGFAVEDVCLLSFAPGAAAGPTRSALLGRIADVSPEAVVALGEEAAQCLLASRDAIAELRGRFIDLQGVPLMATMHPGQLDADPSLKRELWNEMQQVMRRLAARA